MITKLFLVLLCIGIAWYLGYRARPQEEFSEGKNTLPRDYFIGLNFLLNEETDKAVDIFIKMLEVDSDTVETHLAVGKLFRRRGEVDRAIRIHQNLIARPQLERVYREQSLYELGQDYLSAGVLDRAERIFLELVGAKSHSAQALRTLLDIYQQEKAWESAIDTAQKFEAVTRQNMQPVIAHHYCELADIAYARNEINLTLDYLDKSISADPACVRASLLQARIKMDAGEYKAALRILKRIKDQNPNYLSEALDMLASCYEHLDQKEELVDYLKELADKYPRIPVVLILTEQIRRFRSEEVAIHFVADYVRRYPSLRGLYSLVNLYLSNTEGRAKDDLHLLEKLMQKVLANKPDYQCNSCGFAGKSLHWHCPGCKQWGTILPIYHLEEELA